MTETIPVRDANPVRTRIGLAKIKLVSQIIDE